jgi:hypothetical protein
MRRKNKVGLVSRETSHPLSCAVRVNLSGSDTALSHGQSIEAEILQHLVGRHRTCQFHVKQLVWQRRQER